MTLQTTFSTAGYISDAQSLTGQGWLCFQSLPEPSRTFQSLPEPDIWEGNCWHLHRVSSDGAPQSMGSQVGRELPFAVLCTCFQLSPGSHTVLHFLGEGARLWRLAGAMRARPVRGLRARARLEWDSTLAHTPGLGPGTGSAHVPLTLGSNKAQGQM